jgi:hypothetical protein
MAIASNGLAEETTASETIKDHNERDIPPLTIRL